MSEIVSISSNKKIIIAADSIQSGYENDLHLGATALNSKVKFYPILNCYIGTVGSVNMSLAVEQFITENPEIIDAKKLIIQIKDLSNYVLEFENLIQQNNLKDKTSIGQIYIYAYTDLDFDSNNNLVESDLSFRIFGAFVKNNPLLFKPYSSNDKNINYQLGQRLSCHGGELKDSVDIELNRFSKKLNNSDAENFLVGLLKRNKSIGKIVEANDVIGGPIIIYTLEIINSKFIASEYVLENAFGDSELIYNQIINNKTNDFLTISKLISNIVSKNQNLNIENNRFKDELLMLRIDNYDLISISKELYKRLKTPYLLRVFYSVKAWYIRKRKNLPSENRI